VSRKPFQPLGILDPVVGTLYYRAPEVLLGSPHYNRPIDIWAAACVLAELVALQPIFPGQEVQKAPSAAPPFQYYQISRILDVLGTIQDDWPSVRDMPAYGMMRLFSSVRPNTLAVWCELEGYTSQDDPEAYSMYELLRDMFAYDPAKRLSAQTAMEQSWFTKEPLPTAKYVIVRVRGLPVSDNKIQSSTVPS
jgi:cyclin-dependent kinase 8/11